MYFVSPSRNVDGLGLKCQDQSQTVTLILERKTEWPGMGIYGSLTEDIPEHIACKCGKSETILTMELSSKGKKARSRKSLKNPSYYSGLAQRTSGDVSLKQPSSTSTHSLLQILFQIKIILRLVTKMQFQWLPKVFL